MGALPWRLILYMLSIVLFIFTIPRLHLLYIMYLFVILLVYMYLAFA